VPRAWVEQTRPGGVIVAPWGTEYGGEYIMRLAVGEDGAASGPFTHFSAFMRLRQQRTERPPFDAYLKGREWPADGVRGVTALSPADIGGWLEQFVIGLHVPGAFWRAERYNHGAYTLRKRLSAGGEQPPLLRPLQAHRGRRRGAGLARLPGQAGTPTG
ncbi:hypothetical protein ACH427_30875, partial [Streptomyces sp. NPDC020379]